MFLKQNSITSVILAGGNNSRYNGTPKALLEINGKTLYQITKEKLEKIFESVILITNNPEIFPDDNCLKFSDIIKNIGPLGGIHSALTNTQNKEAIFVTAVDMPFLNEEIIKKIVTQYLENKSDILIPRIKNNIEPLNAIYKTSILSELNDFIKNTKHYATRDFFSKVNAKYLDFEDSADNLKAFVNVNTPEEFAYFTQNKNKIVLQRTLRKNH
ncbi:MAG: hypothetical protein A2046_09845 [Bacteroidetes bacterium GWA2_30_7]|nr:MAG: hypothetical protein A2046_09845 [Bacteroidetes bacterium GWA2_30_7]